jgi:hypothetical protein
MPHTHDKSQPKGSPNQEYIDENLQQALIAPW